MLGKILGFSEKSTGKALDLVDKGLNGIDALVFTEEEKSEVALKSAQLKLDIIRATASENSNQSITRRNTALAIIYYTLAMVTFISFLSLFWKEKAETITKICIEWYIPWAFVAVVGFFFTNHVIGSYQRNKK